MPAGYVNLPAAQFPRNAMLDFSPIQQGIESGRNWAVQEQNAMLRQKQDARADADQAMQKTNFGNQQTTFQQGQEDRNKLAFGRRAQAVDQMTDPAQRASAWSQILARHPNSAGLDPIYKDPMQGPKLVQAEAGLLDTMGKETPSNVKEWNYYNKLPEDQKQQYLTMKRAEKFYDTGPQFTAPNPVNPNAPPRVLPKDVAGEKAQQEIGAAQGKAAAALPNVEGASARMLDTIDSVAADPGLGNVTGFIGGRIPEKIQTEGMAESQSRINQLGGQTFLQAYNDLRGAGQISEREGIAAQAAYNRLMTQTMGTQAYKDALAEFRGQVVKLTGIARQRAAAAGQVQTNNGPASKVMNEPLGAPRQVPDIRSGGSAAPQIPPQAVRLLQGSPTPDVVQQFEAKYGPGSSRQFLQAR